jgi:hypothetical protein
MAGYLKAMHSRTFLALVGRREMPWLLIKQPLRSLLDRSEHFP